MSFLQHITGGIMTARIDGPIATKVFTTTDGRAVIEQSNGSTVVLAADQILAVINELHACYDYCAAWKQPAQGQDRATTEMKP
jgi:hypothetical protein